MHNDRNDGSVTSSIGAKNNGLLPNSISAIFNVVGFVDYYKFAASATNYLFGKNSYFMIERIKEHTYLQLIFVGLVLFVGSLVFTGLAFIISSVVWGMDTTQLAMSGYSETTAQISILKIVQFASQLSIFVVPPMALWFIMRKDNPNYLCLSKAPSFMHILLVISLFIVFVPFLEYTIVWNEAMSLGTYFGDLEQWMRNSQDVNDQMTTRFLAGTSVSTLVVNLIIMALMPAIGEELLFRGVLMNWFSKVFSNIHINILITAIIFSAIHMQFYGFIPRMLLGMLLGYSVYWTRSLWAPIILHFINNGITVVTIYYYNVNNPEEDIKDLATSSTDAMVMMSVALSAFVLWMFYKNRVQDVAEIKTELL